MAALNWSPQGMLRCAVPLRSVLVWLLLALLVTGAASYSHGSRYAIVPGHGPVQSADAQNVGGVLQQVDSAVSPADSSAPASQAPRVVHQVGPAVDFEELEKDCCERRQAPRSEPVPVRTGAVDPPSLTHRLPGDGALSSEMPPEPDLPVLTVVELSISRT